MYFVNSSCRALRAVLFIPFFSTEHRVEASYENMQNDVRMMQSNRISVEKR